MKKGIMNTVILAACLLIPFRVASAQNLSIEETVAYINGKAASYCWANGCLYNELKLVPRENGTIKEFLVIQKQGGIMTKRINIPLWGISKKGITNVSEGVRIECYYSTVINSSNCIDFHDRSNDNNPRADNKPVSHGSRAEFYCGGNCLTAFKYLADKLGVQDEPDKDPFAR